MYFLQLIATVLVMYILTGNMSSAAIEIAEYLNSKKILSALIIQESCYVSLVKKLKSKVSQMYFAFFGRAENPIIGLLGSYRLKKLTKNFNGQVIKTNDFNKSTKVKELLLSSKASYVIVIGGKIISKDSLDRFKGNWINVHTGVLPHYRGLDSEYWAVKNKDLGNIGVTLHWVNEELDSGEIIKISKIDVMNLDESLISVKKRNLKNAEKTIKLLISEIQDLALKPISPDSKVLKSSNSYYSSPSISISFRKPLSHYLSL